MQEYWPLISEKLKNTLESGVYKVWIAPLDVTVTQGHVQLYARSSFASRWVRDHWEEAILQAARSVLEREDVTLEFLVAAPQPVASGAAVSEAGASDASIIKGGVAAVQSEGNTPPALPSAVNGAKVPLPVGLPPVPRWRYDFEDFVVGESNTVAYAAAQDLCRARPSVETLFVSAASGLGKTHLVQAVGQALCQDKAQVGYLTAEEFTSRFVLASRTHQMDAFKASLRSLDVLLLEDVHFFQGKERTQEEVLATIKALLQRGSRLVLTSTFSPRELHHMDSQLVSHLSAGMLTIMQKPTHDMRCEILQRKARVHQVLLPDSVADLIASRLTNDVRQLESCLNSLLFKARHLKIEVSLDMALEVLGQYATVATPVTLERIISLVCEGYGLSEAQLYSKSRKHEYVLARNTVFFLARKHTDLSLQDIGERFNRRHSTVINGITTLEQEVKRETRLGRQLANTIKMVEKNAGICAL